MEDDWISDQYKKQFRCPICLSLLKDPVSLLCGHSYCMVCINSYWDHEEQRRVFSCPQCRGTYSPRPVLCRNIIVAEMMEKLTKTELQPASPDCYNGGEDVDCDFCTGTKQKAIKSCLTCVVSYCEAHLKPHLENPALKKHKLGEVSRRLQEKICSFHEEVRKIYCRTDQSCICNLCTLDEHKDHDTVPVTAERPKKLSELKEVQRKCQQRLEERQKMVEDLKQAVNALQRSAQTAVEDSERICTELICSIEKKRSEVRKLISDQEKAEVSRAEGVLGQLEQEIADLKRRDAELEQLSHTEDHILFLQSFQSLCVSSESEDSSSITLIEHFSLDGVRESFSDLKEKLVEFCRDELNKITPDAMTGQLILPLEQKTKEGFLKYFCRLTLNPNTVHRRLSLSRNNRAVTRSETVQPYADHPERFDFWHQVLCKESVCGRCYWEVECRTGKFGSVFISVTYSAIRRKGEGYECWFGHNDQSWSLCCSSTLSFWHNNMETKISGPSSCRIGVYVDHSAGTLSFYGVSDKMTLLHTVNTTFTQPLYAGFMIHGSGSVKLCDLK